MLSLPVAGVAAVCAPCWTPLVGGVGVGAGPAAAAVGAAAAAALVGAAAAPPLVGAAAGGAAPPQAASSEAPPAASRLRAVKRRKPRRLSGGEGAFSESIADSLSAAYAAPVRGRKFAA